MTDFNSLQITSVNDLPGYRAKVAFSMKTAEVFKESGEISPRHLSETLCYMPWGADDQMPFDIIKFIESDETLSTCQMFNLNYSHLNKKKRMFPCPLKNKELTLSA